MELPKPDENQLINFAGTHVAVATPCYGNIHVSQYTRSMAMTAARFQQLGIGFDLMYLTNEAIIGKARNTLVTAFLEGKASHLWFVDADMGWDTDAPIRLLGAMKVSGMEIVAAAGPRKATPLSFCVNTKYNMKKDEKTGFIDATSVGTGFMMMSRSAVEKMVAAHGEDYFIDPLSKKKIYNLFDNEIDDLKQFWSEDYTFCNKWRKLGGDIWIDYSVKLEHVGTHVWSGALQEHLSPWAGSLTGRMQ